VIPVLVAKADMPSKSDLPEEIREITRWQAMELSHARFKEDARRLTRVLRKRMGRRPPWVKWAMIGLLAIYPVVLIVQALLPESPDADFEIIAKDASHRTGIVRGVAPLSVTFVDTTRGKADRWVWWFDDGRERIHETKPGHQVTRTFTRLGRHNVTLTAYNGASPSTTGCGIHIHEPVNASFEVRKYVLSREVMFTNKTEHWLVEDGALAGRRVALGLWGRNPLRRIRSPAQGLRSRKIRRRPDGEVAGKEERVPRARCCPVARIRRSVMRCRPIRRVAGADPLAQCPASEHTHE
jgi:hypothetical protein